MAGAAEVGLLSWGGAYPTGLSYLALADLSTVLFLSCPAVDGLGGVDGLFSSLAMKRSGPPTPGTLANVVDRGSGCR